MPLQYSGNSRTDCSNFGSTYPTSSCILGVYVYYSSSVVQQLHIFAYIHFRAPLKSDASALNKYRIIKSLIYMLSQRFYYRAKYNMWIYLRLNLFISSENYALFNMKNSSYESYISPVYEIFYCYVTASRRFICERCTKNRADFKNGFFLVSLSTLLFFL